MLSLSLRNCFLLASLVHVLVTSRAADLRLDGGDRWDENDWYVQVDGVMGGRSSGFMEFTDDAMVFSGEISLTGGGFSSVRKYMEERVDLSAYAGIVVDLEAHQYGAAPLGLHLQLHDSSSRYGYASAFAVPLAEQDGGSTSVFLPLESFDRAGFPCRNPNNCGILDTSRINEMDIYVLFQEGPFNIRVQSITAVENATSFESPVIELTSRNQVKSLIDQTTKSGGGLYNYGYRELCIAMYRSTLNTLLASNGTAVTDDMKGLICEGLQQAASFETTEKVDVAWSLRATLDAVEETLTFNGSSGQSTSNEWEDQCIAVTSFPPVDSNGTLLVTSAGRFMSSGPRPNDPMSISVELLVTSLIAASV